MGINQKITIGAVWPQLEKGASARPNVAGGSVGGGALSPPTLPPSKVPTGEGNFKALNCIYIGLNSVQTSEINTFENCKTSTN